MNETFKALCLQLLRIPPEPQPPSGTPGSVKVFRASSNYYWLQVLIWGVRQASVILGILAFLAFWNSASSPRVPSGIRTFVGAIEMLGIIGFVLQLPISFLLVRLDFELRWYMVTDRSLRIRSGVWKVHETTMTFANVQQGPLQRLLGIYDLQVTTAGGGGETGHKGNEPTMHSGCFHGISNAPEVKEMMQERLRQLKGSGLGDPDDPVDSQTTLRPHSHPSQTQSPLAAALELAEEARLLRLAHQQNPHA
ncbi:MAG: hypothetical protein FJ405_03215 [Verrucomicrobia bacterium]|nr:hypothetical protein [Verrucomicrobiota bacterium]